MICQLDTWACERFGSTLVPCADQAAMNEALTPLQAGARTLAKLKRYMRSDGSVSAAFATAPSASDAPVPSCVRRVP